jgi:pilus assembly protein CpaF
MGLDLDGLARSGSMPTSILPFLRGVVAARLNILVSGGTDAGKTTFLNALSESIGAHERVVTIEDSAELQLRRRHVVRLETRPPAVDGTPEVTTRALVRNALRMRPDRILVGEVRGAEAIDMLQAMNTGHEGSMSTVHANSPRDVLARLETMVGMSDVALDERAARGQIARSIDMIVQLRRLGDGRRVLERITEVGRLQGDVVTLQDIRVLEIRGVSPDGRSEGVFRATGVRPAFMDRVERAGVKLGPELWRLESPLE